MVPYQSKREDDAIGLTHGIAVKRERTIVHKRAMTENAYKLRLRHWHDLLIEHAFLPLDRDVGHSDHAYKGTMVDKARGAWKNHICRERYFGGPEKE